MKASHDTLTSYPLKQWWLTPLLFAARCQTKTIEEQLASGVRYFDLRFRQYNGKLYAAHGFMVFNITPTQALFRLNAWAVLNKTEIYYRILHEDTFSDDGMSLQKFRNEILRLNSYCSKYMKLHRLGSKKDWSTHEIFNKVEFYGKNDYGLNEIQAKRDEIRTRILIAEPNVYECYSYKLLPFVDKILMKDFVPNNAMSNFTE